MPWNIEFCNSFKIKQLQFWVDLAIDKYVIVDLQEVLSLLYTAATPVILRSPAIQAVIEKNLGQRTNCVISNENEDVIPV